ncbi:MAG: hypothetical protein HY270_05635 [Deltaproteobacteria bacterium]|nr:hypothetical protein [Deltaproteobacteria bacterium]
MTGNTHSSISVSELRLERSLFAFGDLAHGALIGALTAASVHFVIAPSTDMALAMLLGMGLGMILHVAVGIVLTPLLGMFHVMVTGSLVGMYGGMLFAMRETMGSHAPSLEHALATGAAFGGVVAAAVQLYDRMLREPL